MKNPRFQVGDYVRVPDQTNTLQKVIQQIGIERCSELKTQLNSIITYSLEHEDGEQVEKNY